jgi:hypothetical protein
MLFELQNEKEIKSNFLKKQKQKGTSIHGEIME